MPEDPFDVLGVPARFDLDPLAVQRAYLERAAAAHPDLIGDDEGAERSASLNRAKSILDNPEERANALLTRVGGPAKESDRSLPDGFLMEIMEAREAIEAAASSKDGVAMARWRAWAAAQRDGHAARILPMFEAVADAGALRAIRRELNAWRYIERMIEQFGMGRGDGSESP
jgi:molecular chaperone HscB